MDPRERYSDHEEPIRAALDHHQSGMWTALPGRIASFNAAAMTAQVQPTVQGKVRARDGKTSDVDLPMLLDVPVVFPGAGGYTLTFPVAVGDECLVVFASRNIDSFWQSGGVQPQADRRMHDLSDGIALVGAISQTKKIAANTATVQLRSNDGGTYVEIASGGLVTVKAPTKITLDAPEVHTTGKVTTAGNVESAADVLAQTVSLHNHVHTGVASGSSISGLPKP